MRGLKNNLGKIILTFLLGFSIMVKGQVDAPSYFSKEKLLTGGTTIFNAVDIDKTRSGTALNEATTTTKLYLKLDLGEDYVSTGGTFNYSISVDVVVANASSHTGLILAIDEVNPEQLLEVNLLGDIATATSITVTSTVSPANTSSGGITTNYLTNNVRTIATLVREYGVDVRLQSGVVALPVQLQSSVSTGRVVDFVWQTNGTEDFPNYEIQILRLYNVGIVNPANNSGIIGEVDWNKALRVETQSPQKSIMLTIAEGSGFYVWRVRPIGNFHKGGIANQDNYGAWNSTSLMQGTSVSLDQMNVQSRMDAFYFTDPDQDINWIYNRVFTEGNLDPANSGVKASEGMSYADGLLRARQTQAYNSSNNTTLVTQTVSDYSGRPALTTLPVPVANGLTGYKAGFVKNTGGTLYTALDYDIKDGNGDKISDPTPIKQTATDFDYYDGTKTNGVANAEGYPFKRTLFKTDGTGRVTEESGVGKVHALGTQGGILGGGRTTRVLFGTPSDDELIRIFGDEAPLAESVIKTLTIDPNNVVSVTYTSKEGKTIATALISDGSDNLLPLDVKDLSTLTVNNTANQNIVSNNKMISSRRIALEVDKDVTISYDNTAGTPMGACAGGDCGLKLRFFLNDLRTGETYVSNAHSSDPAFPTLFDVGSSIDFTNFTSWTWDNLDPNSTVVGPAIISNTTANSVFHLAYGEYIITKEVFSTNNPNFVEDNMIEYGEQYIPIINALADQMVAIVNPADYALFQSTYMPGLQALILTYQANPTQINSDAIVAYLGMDVVITGATPYLFPDDFTVPNGFLDQDPDDASQNTLTVSMGCCGNLEIPMPKPDICVVCHGVGDDETGNPDFTTIKNQINIDIAADNPLTYGIDDIRNSSTSIFANTNNSWTVFYNDNNGNPIISPEWSAMNDVVGHEFMDYLYRKLADEGFIDLFNQTSSPNGYDSDNPTNYDPSSDTDLQPFFDRFAPGFTYTSMQYMVTNMLISRYHEGQSKLHTDGKYYRAKENQHGWLFFVDDMNDFIASTTAIDVVETRAQFDLFSDGQVGSEVTGIDDGNVDEYNYDCQDLFECWIQAVDLINAFEFDDDMNVMDSFNDEQGGDSSEDHFDDDESKEDDDGSWLMDQIISMVVSAKMRDFQEEAVVPKERLEALVSFPKIFMECAGYKYSAILDETAILPTDYIESTPYNGAIGSFITADYSNDIGHATANSAFAPILVKRNAQGNFLQAFELECGTSSSCKSNVLFYEYTLKPEWLFKYYVYNAYHDNGVMDQVDDDATDFMPVLNQFQIEVNSCYQDLFVAICGAGVINCNDGECRYFNESWSAGQRLNFYQQLEGGRKCPESCASNVAAVNIGLSPDCEPLKDNLLVLANSKLDNAVAVCEYRRAEIKSGIIKELKAGCWDIVECAALAHEISEAQIDLMVDEVVASCVNQIDGIGGIREKLDGGQHAANTNDVLLYNPISPYGSSVMTDFPKCEIISCSFIDISNRTCIASNKKVTVLFPECDLLILEQINSWNFDPSIGIAPGITNCPDYVQKDWVNPGALAPVGTTNIPHLVACVEHPACAGQQCIQTQPTPSPVINTYSSTNNVPGTP